VSPMGKRRLVAEIFDDRKDALRLAQEDSSCVLLAYYVSASKVLRIMWRDSVTEVAFLGSDGTTDMGYASHDLGEDFEGFRTNHCFIGRGGVEELIIDGHSYTWNPHDDGCVIILWKKEVEPKIPKGFILLDGDTNTRIRLRDVSMYGLQEDEAHRVSVCITLTSGRVMVVTGDTDAILGKLDELIGEDQKWTLKS